MNKWSWKKDVEKIKDIARRNFDKKIENEVAFCIWKEYSDDLSANWLSIGDEQHVNEVLAEYLTDIDKLLGALWMWLSEYAYYLRYE